MKAIQWRHGFDDAENKRVGDKCITINEEESLTIQSASRDADINELVKRMGIVDGSILPGTAGLAYDPRYYGDFSEAPTSLREAFDRTREAEERFNDLPAAVRARFVNDPYELVDWIGDPANLEEAVSLGLLVKPPLAEVVTPVKPPAKPEPPSPPAG